MASRSLLDIRLLSMKIFDDLPFKAVGGLIPGSYTRYFHVWDADQTKVEREAGVSHPLTYSLGIAGLSRKDECIQSLSTWNKSSVGGHSVHKAAL